MKRVVGLVGGVCLLAVGVVPVAVAADAGQDIAVRAPLAWRACPAEDKLTGATALGVECATVRVPLDHREPWGQTIKLAVNRIKAKVPRDGGHLGTLLVNPGGPGASGRKLSQYVAAVLPRELRERYDVIGFDPRGVGASKPALSCVDPEVYYRPPRPDAVPRTRAEERRLLDRAKHYAERCGNRWGWMLPHMTTENAARDLDVIRAALGEQRISYLGYSYGTYLGAVYATLFPHRVKRMIMDSSVDPGGVWYRSNLAQNRAFESRHRAFLDWTARHHRVYGLGRSGRQTSFAWQAMRSRLREHPAGGVVGPSELDDTFTLGGYTSRVWPELAAAWSAYVRRGDAKPLLAAYDKHGRNDAEDENGYAVYLAIQCRDARWPRDWNAWRADMTRVHRQAPFLTWPNAWFNAPCAFWPAPGGTPVEVRGSRRLPPILMIQSRGDAATPYAGALSMRSRFPTARMLVEHGGEHGVSLGGNLCVDRHLVAYLKDGTLPAQGARCAAKPDPRPATPVRSERAKDQAAGHAVGHTVGHTVGHAVGRAAGHERLTDALTG